MKRILLSIGSILFAGAILAGGTGAFLADSGSSTGNTFATGVVDLKIDNESYATDEWGKLYFSPSTSWNLSNLAGKLFFNFTDIKPGDIGEDTISIHVNNNNAWSCMNINLSGTPENGQNEPELAVDPTVGTNDGELQNHLYFTFWADDGDNVFEQGEKVFKQGLTRDIFNGENWALADSQTNVWNGTGPLLGATTKYIGKAWCFGTMVSTPLTQDGLGKTGANGPLFRGSGFSCSGADVGNIVQSDGIKVDVSFSVVQSRGNGSFLCKGGEYIPPPPSTSTLFFENFNNCSKDENESRDDSDWDKGKKNDSDRSSRTSNSTGHDGYSWSKKWDCRGDDHSDDSHTQCTQNLDLSAGGTTHSESLITPAFSTTGFHAITLSYTRKTDDTNAPPQPVGAQTLTAEYSVNNGATWTTLETVTGESAQTSKTFSLSPSADNKSNVRIRFSFTGADGTNHAYIDNVAVTGVSP
jgi:hypothetical protein